MAATHRCFAPAYLAAKASGRLAEKIRLARQLMAACRLCPRRCGVDRPGGEKGICQTGALADVSSYDAHFGEEAPLVGTHGSGTIFFTHCNLLCNFCQNEQISHQGMGRPVTDAQLAQIMVSLQQAGCHNINLVTPSHVVPQILAALSIAIDQGLRIPLVYNTSAYDAVETLRLLDGVVDIFMPDFKFWDAAVGRLTCKAPDYPAIARAAIREMHRQVGDLVLDERGIAQRGLLIRHLVMPEGLAGTAQVMTFIAERISPDTYVNIMSQYRPCGRAHAVPSLARRPTSAELADALRAARRAGIHRLDSRRRFILVR
jgi:putative pyruvate formate lyase activating enzyme